MISRFFRSRWLVFLGTYSYGLYVYHHFISYYLTVNHTERELTAWLGSHGAAIALQATLGTAVSVAIAYASYELFEKRFLGLKRFYATAKEPAAKRWHPGSRGKAFQRLGRCAPGIAGFQQLPRRISDRAANSGSASTGSRHPQTRRADPRSGCHVRGPHRCLRRQAWSRPSPCPSPSPRRSSAACRRRDVAARSRPRPQAMRGCRSGTKPVNSIRGPASAVSCWGGQPPMILQRASGFLLRDARPDLVDEPAGAVDVRHVGHQPEEDDGAAVRSWIFGRGL